MEIRAAPAATLAAQIDVAQASRQVQAVREAAGRDHTTPDDIKAIAPDVIRHRLLLTHEAEADDIRSDAIIQRILEGVPVRPDARAGRDGTA